MHGYSAAIEIHADWRVSTLTSSLIESKTRVKLLSSYFYLRNDSWVCIFIRFLFILDFGESGDREIE